MIVNLPFVLSEYVLLPSDTLCSANNMIFIDDINSCKRAAMALEGSRSVIEENQGAVVPRGCNKHVGGDGVRLILDEHGFRGKPNHLESPICQAFG